jgi:hypothetical protein
MSTPERLNGWFQPVAGALVLTSALVLVRKVLPGVGGSLGFAAFVTVAILVALNRAAAWMAREMQPRHNRGGHRRGLLPCSRPPPQRSEILPKPRGRQPIETTHAHRPASRSGAARAQAAEFAIRTPNVF